jgi:hypothetical protein
MKKLYIAFLFIALTTLAKAQQFTVLSITPSVDFPGDFVVVVDAQFSAFPWGTDYGDTVSFIDAKNTSGTILNSIVAPDYVWNPANHTFTIDAVQLQTKQLVFVYTDVNVVDYVVQTITFANPLSVHQFDFNIVKNNVTNQISWQINASDSLQNLELQYCNDGKNFVSIRESMPMQGQYLHLFGNNTINMYRLKATLANGTIQYSNCITCNNTLAVSQINISSNPIQVGDNIELQLPPSTEDFDCVLLAINGQIVHQQKIDKKYSTYSMPTNNLQAGVYFLKIVNTESNKQITVLIR